MSTTSEALAQAVQLHGSGQISAAKQIYQQVLIENENDANALHLLGVVELQQGAPESAIDLIKQAIALCPNDANFHSNLATAYEVSGNFQSANDAWQVVLAGNPRSESALCGIGRSLKSLGHREEAIAKFQLALAIRPDHVDAHVDLAHLYISRDEFELALHHFLEASKHADDRADLLVDVGNLCRSMKRHEDALHYYTLALQRDPCSVEAYNEMGVTASTIGRVGEALEHFESAIKFGDPKGQANSNLGKVLCDDGRFEEAEIVCRKAIEIDPNNPIFHNNLGIALMSFQRDAEARSCFHRAIELDPNYALAWQNAGVICQRFREHDEAIKCYEKSNQLIPRNINTLQNLANLYSQLRQPERTLEIYEAACQIDPNHAICLAQLIFFKLELVQWDDVSELWERFQKMEKELPFPITPLTLMAFPSSPGELLHSARAWAKSIRRPERVHAKKRGDHLSTSSSTKIGPRKKLRVGYLSADFRQHPVAQLAVEMIENHDRERFEVFGYAIGGNDQTPLGTRIRSAFDSLTDLDGMTDLEAIKKIRADQIDILVDLVGYTKSTREEILTARPAAIQVNYLGFPGSMGAEWIDYIVGDQFVIPDDSHAHFSEMPILMPDCFQVNAALSDDALPVPARQACGLPEEAVVLCCFNTLHKINPQVWSAWMKILEAAPSSVLWLKTSKEGLQQNFRNEASKCGIDSGRIYFAEKTQTIEAHYQRVQVADMFLDTWPYNAHATASDMLRCGVPVLTNAGQTMASRVAGSLLNCLGLNELITYSVEQYVSTAIELISSPEQLARMSERLRIALSSTPLFDNSHFTREIENAFEEIVRIRDNGESPRAVYVEELKKGNCKTSPMGKRVQKFSSAS